ncbi:IS3 family transposase [Pusillimonas sp. ANT_WB101]|nr:IS3 family transposase [Pusillimonas sp. ANT_WB101]
MSGSVLNLACSASLRVLQVRRHAARGRQPQLRSQRARKDEQLKPQIYRIWEQNFRGYGTRKVWMQMNREGIRVARCTVERLSMPNKLSMRCRQEVGHVRRKRHAGQTFHKQKLSLRVYFQENDLIVLVDFCIDNTHGQAKIVHQPNKT